MPKNILTVTALAVVSSFSIFPAMAHEFWITPENYNPPTGASLAVKLETGQMMKGVGYPYLSHRFQSFTITTGKGTRDAKGNEGDDPAFTYVADDPGLNIIAYHSTPLQITYVTLDQFAKYLELEGLGHIIQDHKMRGLPNSRFSEHYITRIMDKPRAYCLF